MFTKIFQFITEINEGDVEITTASCEKNIDNINGNNITSKLTNNNMAL